MAEIDTIIGDSKYYDKHAVELLGGVRLGDCCRLLFVSVVSVPVQGVYSYSCWIYPRSIVFFSLSPLFGTSTARYYAEAYVCVVDWSSQTAYFITAAVLLVVPPLVVLGFANVYIFTSTYDRDKAAYDRTSFEPPVVRRDAQATGAVLQVTIESTRPELYVSLLLAYYCYYTTTTTTDARGRPELYAVNVIVGWVYVVVWMPWCILQLLSCTRRCYTDARI